MVRHPLCMYAAVPSLSSIVVLQLLGEHSNTSCCKVFPGKKLLLQLTPPNSETHKIRDAWLMTSINLQCRFCWRSCFVMTIPACTPILLGELTGHQPFSFIFSFEVLCGRSRQQYWQTFFSSFSRPVSQHILYPGASRGM